MLIISFFRFFFSFTNFRLLQITIDDKVIHTFHSHILYRSDIQIFTTDKSHNLQNFSMV